MLPAARVVGGGIAWFDEGSRILGIAELKALLLAEGVTGRVINLRFVLTGKHLAAPHQFAATTGVADPANAPPDR